MRSRVKWALLALASLVATTSYAQDQTFLLPASAEQSKRLLDTDLLAIRKAEFFGKQSRIVRINAATLLSGDDVITIPLFNGRAVKAKRIELVRSPGDISIRWTGAYVDPPISANEFIAQMPDTPEKIARQLYDDIFTFTIYANKYSIDPDSGEVIELQGLWVDPETNRLMTADQKFGNRIRNSGSVYGATFSFRPVFPTDRAGQPPSAEYALRELPGNPEYGVLIELDSSKAFAGGDGDMSPAQRQRYEAYKQHMEKAQRELRMQERQ